MAKKKYNPVVHFEMPMDDLKRASKIYEDVFGWEMQDMGEQYGGYLMAMTDKSDRNVPLKKGRINGGFFPRQEPADRTHLVISVENLKEAMDRVEKAGGKVVDKPRDIANVGKFVMIVDTEKNLVALLQPVKM